ncbi:hypothetical protein HK096_001770, partial [Nowakowskiella sp. JEL0078]
MTGYFKCVLKLHDTELSSAEGLSKSGAKENVVKLMKLTDPLTVTVEIMKPSSTEDYLNVTDRVEDVDLIDDRMTVMTLVLSDLCHCVQEIAAKRAHNVKLRNEKHLLALEGRKICAPKSQDNFVDNSEKLLSKFAKDVIALPWDSSTIDLNSSSLSDRGEMEVDDEIFDDDISLRNTFLTVSLPSTPAEESTDDSESEISISEMENLVFERKIEDAGFCLSELELDSPAELTKQKIPLYAFGNSNFFLQDRTHDIETKKIRLSERRLIKQPEELLIPATAHTTVKIIEENKTKSSQRMTEQKANFE